jgi:hypothetical protein
MVLANEYTIFATPFFKPPLPLPEVANIDQWPGPPASTEEPPLPGGAIVFRTSAACGRAMGVWLFSRVAFASTSSTPLDFVPSVLSRVVGSFHVFRGCFWLESHADGVLSIGDISLKQGDLAPLISGQLLFVRGRGYRVEITPPGAVPVSDEADALDEEEA